MKTFEEFQTAATQVPVSLRNNRDRIELPIRGLQEEAGKIGTMLAMSLASGRFSLTAEQRMEMKDRLSDVLWFVALLCGESGLAMQDVVSHGVAKLQSRAKELDPDQR